MRTIKDSQLQLISSTPGLRCENQGLTRQIDIFHKIIAEYIPNLIHDAQVIGPLSKSCGNYVSLENPCRISLSMPHYPQQAVILERQTPFSDDEYRMVLNIVQKMSASRVWEYKSYHHLMNDCVEQAIARQLSPQHADTIYMVLQIYNQWVSETLEGRRFAHTIGIYFNQSQCAGGDLFSLRNTPSLKVLGTTPGTLLAVGNDGTVLAVENTSAKLNNYLKDKNILSPINMDDIAAWTNSNNRLAIRMTESGELLIFKNKTLVFAKRRSFWNSFPHQVLLNQLLDLHVPENEQETIKAVYLTVLDLAFAGKGGCIGIVDYGNSFIDYNIAADNEKPQHSAECLLQCIVAGRSFAEIPRRQRINFCAVDGAVIIDRQGTVYTVGAIVQTNGRTLEGGGRAAAAKALGEKGWA